VIRRTTSSTSPSRKRADDVGRLDGQNDGPRDGAPARDSFDSTWQAAHFKGIQRLLD
jgi:hypothetical protein